MAECTNCRQSLDPEDKFCRKCGEPLESAPPPRFKPLLPSTPEEMNAYRSSLRPFFLTALAFCAGLALLGFIAKSVWNYFSGQ